MRNLLIYPVGTSKSCFYAIQQLNQHGITLIDHPSPEVTHLLMDIPSFAQSGNLQNILSMLPRNVTVIGGNLQHPALTEHNRMDLLKDTQYLAHNAALTAECALRVASPLLKCAFYNCPVLVIGWGRIGKCLGTLMNAIGARVTIAARKDTDLAMAQALGYRAVAIREMDSILPNMKLIYNTVPQMLLPQEQLAHCRSSVKIDLASVPGMEGEDVIWARGLPGIHVPESSGKLIADTIFRIIREESK